MENQEHQFDIMNFIHDLQKLKTSEVIAEIAGAGLSESEMLTCIKAIAANDTFKYESKYCPEEDLRMLYDIMRDEGMTIPDYEEWKEETVEGFDHYCKTCKQTPLKTYSKYIQGQIYYLKS